MLLKLMRVIMRNVIRARTRALITIFGCVIASFVICFFMTAEHSLSKILGSVENDSNLIITQKDRF
jgi:hypothetical protein